MFRTPKPQPTEGNPEDTDRVSRTGCRRPKSTNIFTNVKIFVYIF